MPSKMNLVGHCYGRLLVTGEPVDNTYPYKWDCLCDCGNTTTVFGVSIRSGKTTSCGCYSQERKSQRMTRHGNSSTRLHIIWRAMIRRCYSPTASNYHNYGALGVRVCDEWLNSYDSFSAWALANGYNDTLSIDRINSGLLYSPQTCRWATDTIQARNRKKQPNKSSQYIGISYDPKRDKYMALISVNKKYINLGRYHIEEEAAHARDDYIRQQGLDGYVLNFP